MAKKITEMSCHELNTFRGDVEKWIENNNQNKKEMPKIDFFEQHSTTLQSLYDKIEEEINKRCPAITVADLMIALSKILGDEGWTDKAQEISDKIEEQCKEYLG